MTRAAYQSTGRNNLPDWSLVRTVLLIRLRSIGDTVLMTASLRALKSWRPDVEVAVLSEPLAAPILDAHPLVDKLIIAEKSLAARARLVTRLRREQFDIAFNLHGGTTATIIAALAGAGHTVGYRGYRNSWMLGARAPSPDKILGRARLHSVEKQLALLHWAGVPWPSGRPRLEVVVSPEAEASCYEKLATIGVAERAAFACVSPAAALESKRWGAAGFAAIADHLSKRWGLRSVVIAGPGQEHVAREVAGATRAGARVLTGLSLKELIALVGLAQVFVGNDSGPMHVAAALKRPLVAVFGSSNADVWHPWTDAPYRVVSGRGDSRDVEASPPHDSRPEIRSIPTSRVIAAVDEVLELAPAAGFKADANLSGG
ncbi:MAG TPA: glycosyltransferase family 9 protein [Blastocatellia bacterium]|nr:glycosyltransferase family 9 protein [Blastocatellia bacterium]